MSRGGLPISETEYTADRCQSEGAGTDELLVVYNRRVTARSKVVAVALVALGGLSLGCEISTSELQIGVRNDSGEFVLVGAGDSMGVVRGPNALDMIVPSVRAVGIDPQTPDPVVEVKVGGQVLAVDIEGPRVDMEQSPEGYVLWELRVPFSVNLCCFNCREALVTASIEDSSGNKFAGEITVMLERDSCPDPTTCCETAGACPDPSTAQVCK